MKRLALLVLALFLSGCFSQPLTVIPAGTLAAQTLAARPTTALPPPTATNLPPPTFTPDSRPPTPALDLSIPGAYCLPPAGRRASGLVTRVLSGDQIEVATNNQSWLVRLIGLDAPNLQAPAEWQAGQSQAFVSDQINGKQITLVQDVTDQDAQGFHPCYVVADGVFLNYEIIRQGFARSLDVPPDSSCRDAFVAAQVEAQSAVRGVWQPTPTLGPTETPTPTITFTPGPVTATTQPVCGCNRSYTCSDFRTQNEAQSCYNYCLKTKNVYVLPDKNNNGIVCEGSSNKKKP